MAFTITINAVDKTSMIKAKSLSIKDALTSKVDTCSFILEDIAGTNKPQEGQEVIVTYGGTKIFAGNIIRKPQTQISPGIYKYAVNCVDYSRSLDKKLVVQSYTEKTCAYIINDIITKYTSGFTQNHVQTGPTVNFIAWNYKPVGQCIKELARLTHYDWYVDYDKDIHFFARETNAAPYELNETASSGRYKGLSIDIDKSQLKNRVFVRGGYYLSNLYTQEKVADGEQLEFLLAYGPQTPMKVYVDDVEKTLGIDNIDTAGKDFVVNVTEKTIKNLDYAKLTAGQVFKATYTYKVPILCMVEDTESQNAVKAIEGGDGIYEALVTDESIETNEAARDRARAELKQYSNALVKGSFKTDQDGYRSGQLLTVNIPTRSINSQYLIQAVTKKSIGGGYLEYTVTFATLLTGLTDFLLSLWEEGKKIVTRKDEVLDEFVGIEMNTITLSDAAPTFEEYTPPFQYGPGGSPQGVYNESQYS